MIIGVDIGSRLVKMVVADNSRHPQVFSYKSFPTPGSAVEDGSVSPDDELVAALKEHLSQLPRCPIVASISTRQAAVRTAVFPRMTERELEGVLRWQAEKYIPLPGEHIFDSAIVRGDGPDMSVLLVAAARGVVTGLAQTFILAGRRLEAIDLDSLAALRALDAMGVVGEEQTAAMVDMGEEGTRLTILADGIPAANRFIQVGGVDFTSAVLAGGLRGMDEANSLRDTYGIRPGTPISDQVRPVWERLMGEVERSLHFYMARNSTRRLRRVFLIGGVAQMPGVEEEMEARLVSHMGDRLSVHQGLIRLVSPLENDGVLIRQGVRRDAIDPLDARYVIALGLTLWGGRG